MGGVDKWSAEEEDTLRAMWSAGNMLTEIARAVSKSPSSVFNKADRMGLPRRGRGGRVTFQRSNKWMTLKDEDDGGLDAQVTFSKYRAASQCPAVIGEPGLMDSDVCGRPRAEGSRWCAHHRDLYTVKAKPVKLPAELLKS